MSIIIEGEMGKGGKTPVETKDTLVSEQTAKLLFAVGEGVLHGYQDIYLDTIPISNFDATHDFRDGSAVQTAIPGFTVTEAPLPSFASTVVERGTTKTPGHEPENFTPNKYYAIIPYTTDAARLTFSLSVMSTMDGDGNLVGSSITLEVWARPTSASIWTSQGTLTKKGKTTHGYTFDTTIERPAGAISTSAWEIMVQRVTPDSNSSKKQNSTTWAAVTQLYYGSTSFDNTYPNTALVGVMINDAAQFGSRIPEVMFKLLGKRVRIPSNYNEATREYFGVWDGTFKLYNAYTNNPAWCLLDVLLDTRSGLSISLSDIDIYAIYNLAKYADNMIDDGHGGTIPRYTLDYQFQNRQGVREFLSQILSLCNANFIVNEFGQLSVIFQAPGQAVTRNVANANVIDGSFTYQSSDIEKRTNLVNVTYNNGLNFGRTDTATVKDDAAITRYGLQVTDVVLPGCLYEAQAIRKARWALYTNCYFTNLVTFSVFLEGLTYKVGDLIRVFDNYNQDSTQSGIVTSCTSGASTTLTFDRAITLQTGTYTFYCYDTSGNEVTKSVTGPATLSNIVISSNVIVNTNSIFIFSGSTGLAAGKLYRVMSIDKSEDSIYSVTALEFSEDIFTYIEQGITIAAKTGDFANLTNFVTPPVTAISVLENFGTNGVYTSGRLQVSWVWDAGNTQKYRARFKLTWVKDDGIVHIVNDIGTDTLDIMDPTPGIYTITVWAVNPFTGISSTKYSYSYSFRVSAGGGTSSLQAPLNLRITGTNAVSPQPTALNFDTQDLSITFDYNPANTNVSDALYDYLVEIWDLTGSTKKASYSVNPFSGPATVDPIDNTLTYIPLNGLFLFPFNENVNVFAGTPARTFIVKVYSRDTLGDLSAPIGVQFTNPVPAFTTLTVLPDINKVLVTVTASTERDIKEYIVYRGTTTNFTANDAAIVYHGTGNSVNITTPDNNLYYYKAAISDNFGSTGLNVSGSVSASSISGIVDRFSYTGLQFSTDKATNVVSWTAFTAYKSDGTSESISAGSAAWTSGVVYLYYVPGNTTLQSTTSPLIAVSGRILATYAGGNNITADSGKAFIDGDQIIAGSLLANALATNIAYITNMAQIGNIIQSDNYNDTPGSYAGWRIDKNGVAKFTGLVVRSGTLGSSGTDVDTVVSNSSTALSTANSASSAASTAQSTANSAQTTANSASTAASSAQTTANSAATAAADRLSKSVNNILSGSGAIIAGNITTDGSGNRTGGYGVAMTPTGLVGYKSGVTDPSFAVDTNGNAYFRGTLSVGSTPAVSGTTMAGTGGIVNTDGSFAFGNSSNNISFSGGTLTINGSVVVTDNLKSNTTFNLYYDNYSTPIALATAVSGGVVNASPVYTSYDYQNIYSGGTLSFDISFTLYNTATATTRRIQYMVEVKVGTVWVKLSPDYTVVSLAGGSTTGNFANGNNSLGTSGSSIDVYVQSAGWSYLSGQAIAVRITAVPESSNSNTYIGNIKWKALLKKK